MYSCINQNKDSSLQFPKVQLGDNIDFIDLDEQTGWYRTRLKEPSYWGFIDKDSVVKIPFLFEYINPFDSENMTYGQIGDKYGYLNTNFDTIIPFKYDELRSFNHGLAQAELDGMHGFLNRRGETMIPFVYDDARSFESWGIAKVSKNNKWGYIDTTGKEIIPIIYPDAVSHRGDSLLFLSQNNKWGIFNHKGNQYSKFIYDEIYGTYKNFDYYNSNYLFKGLLLVRTGNQYRYLNRDLEIVTDFGYYTKAEPVTQFGYALVKKGSFYGVIDSMNNVAVPFKYSLIEHPRRPYQGFYDEFYIHKNGNVGILNEKAELIADIIYDSFERDYAKINDSSQVIFITQKDHHYGIIDKSGDITLPIEFEKILLFEGNITSIAKKNGLYGIVDSHGNVKMPFDYQYITTNRDWDYFILQKDKTFGVVDKQSLQEILPLEYQDLEQCFYDENRFIVKKGGKYGVITRSKEVIIPIEYDTISNWVEYGPKEHFIVKNRKHGLISRDGDVVIPPIYDEIFVDNGSLIKVQNNNLFGTIDWENEIIHPIKYENIFWEWPYLTGKPIDTIYIEKSGKYFATDTKGNVIEASVPEELIIDKFGYLLRNMDELIIIDE